MAHGKAPSLGFSLRNPPGCTQGVSAEGAGQVGLRGKKCSEEGKGSSRAGPSGLILAGRRPR